MFLKPNNNKTPEFHYRLRKVLSIKNDGAKILFLTLIDVISYLIDLILFIQRFKAIVSLLQIL